MERPPRRPPLQQRRQRSHNDDNKSHATALMMTPSKTTTAVGWLLLLLTIHAAILIAPTAEAAAFIIISSPTMIGAYHTTTLSVGSSQQRRRHQYDCCYSDPIVRKSDQQHQRGRLATTRVLSLSSSSQTEELDMDSLSYEMFKRRRDRIDLRKLVEDDSNGKYYHGDDKDEQQQQQQQTPNEFVTQILRELRYPKLYPNHLSGVTMLLQSSTHAWRQTLYKSVGCNVDPPKLGGEDHNTSTVDETRIAQSLLSALSNINSQFGILVGVANDKEFVLDFPTEPVEYEDFVDSSSSSDESEEDSSSSSACSSPSSSSSSCWLECRVRDKFTDELLIVMGWTLVKKEKSSWSIDSLDWQDFRDDFRPGIGREEWERICG